MSDRFFLDTNIFVCSFDRNAPQKAERAVRLVRRAIETREGIVSYQVVQEFFSIALRRFAQPMLANDAEQYLATTFRPLLAVHSSDALYSQALHLTSEHSLSWYDALILASAFEGNCRVLYSEDFQHGRRFSRLRVENPFL